MDDFDPTLPEDLETPYVLYRELRAKCPVAHTSKMGGFWALTRYADIAQVAGDYAQFTTTIQNVVPKVAAVGRRPPLHLDPPDHTHYRRALAPLMTDKNVQALRPFTQKVCDDLLAGMLATGGGDICADYAAILPVRVFARWMNLSGAQADALARTATIYNFAVQSLNGNVSRETSGQLYDMARAIVSERKTMPLEARLDAVTALLAIRVNGEPLPDEMIVGTIRQVLVVGIIAPQVVFGSLTVHLAKDPALQQQLRSSPHLIPAAIEEFLRLYTPYRGFARTTTSDINLHGVTIPKDDAVALVYASANRDEAVFDEPETFRLHRSNIKESLAFGRGPHVCLGAGLARLELIVALERLLAGTRHFQLNGPIVPTRMPEIGTLQVPISFEA